MNQGLSQLGRQLAGVWKQLGLNQRVTLVLTGIVVLGSLLGLGYWSSRTEYALLYGRLDESESARVVAALDESKVSYKMRPGGGILVPSGQVHAVRAQLAGKGIPRGEGVGFEIFDQPNFGLSDFIQRANYTRALQGELARTIAQLDQVEGARVMIVMPESRLLIGSPPRPTASVFVKVRGVGPLSAATVGSIQLLVANSVEGLQASSVSVVDNLGNMLSESQGDDTLAGLTRDQLSARKNLEQYLGKKAQGMLEEVLGPGQAVVRIAAEINFDTVTRFEEKYDPEGQVIRQSTIDDENVESTTPGSGGAAGVSANVNTDTNAAAASAANLSRTKKKTTTSQYEINRTVSSQTQNAGATERLSAAVFVAQRFEGTGEARKAVPRTPEELQKLRRIVQTALGIVENDPTRTDQITLEEIPFNDQPVVELVQQIDRQQQRQYWMELAQKLAPLVLGLGVLFLFWRSFRRTKAEDASLGLPATEAAGEPGAEALSFPGRNGESERKKEKEKEEEEPPLVTVEVLNQLIRENPASMTHAVRSWMSRGTPSR